MKVLWFTLTHSCYEPIANSEIKSLYNGCGWLSAAEKEVTSSGMVDLAVSFMLNNQPWKVEQHGVTYYPISYNKQSKVDRFKYYLNLYKGKGVKNEESSWPYILGCMKRVVDDFQPDVIHVWGSELHFGLVSKVTNVPVILHIQGILNPYLNAFLPPFFNWNNLAEMTIKPMDFIKSRVIKQQWEVICYRERTIIKGIKWYMGRTEWDKRVTAVLNPQMKYLHVDEMLRGVFYEPSHRDPPKRLTVVTTISSPLYKGYDMVLKTAKLLKENLVADFEWQCYGNINPDKVEKCLGICHKDVNVRLMGVATAEQLREAELQATLYFHPSYIDNSPNSLCEAQILGLPVIAVNVGGIPSLIKDGEDGYLVPSNDPFQAAYLTYILFKNKSLNKLMGERGKTTASLRHDRCHVVSQILEAYKKITNKE